MNYRITIEAPGGSLATQVVRAESAKEAELAMLADMACVTAQTGQRGRIHSVEPTDDEPTPYMTVVKRGPGQIGVPVGGRIYPE